MAVLNRNMTATTAINIRFSTTPPPRISLDSSKLFYPCRLRNTQKASGLPSLSVAPAKLYNTQPCCSIASIISDQSTTSPENPSFIIGQLSFATKICRPASIASYASLASDSDFVLLIQPILCQLPYCL